MTTEGYHRFSSFGSGGWGEGCSAATCNFTTRCHWILQTEPLWTCAMQRVTTWANSENIYYSDSHVDVPLCPALLLLFTKHQSICFTSHKIPISTQLLNEQKCVLSSVRVAIQSSLIVTWKRSQRRLVCFWIHVFFFWRLWCIFFIFILYPVSCVCPSTQSRSVFCPSQDTTAHWHKPQYTFFTQFTGFEWRLLFC